MTTRHPDGRVALIIPAIEPYQFVANWNLVDVMEAATRVVSDATEDEVGEAMQVLSDELHRQCSAIYWSADIGTPTA
ncbi:hypothetical protein PRN20_04425 [Devosia sp. ZB163]|uniref:hypothetical protein n=1 Tax=Devosia sp. ZB163 TaxID=3025938 RepID=UPI00235E9658|nr:hypothetical protein [Devosia sp. ZB163]MDC9822967.1 hypothetical protein [Devosia sp. ZB163]